MTEPTPLHPVKINALCSWMSHLTGHEWEAQTDQEHYPEREFDKYSKQDWYLVSRDYELSIHMAWDRYHNKGRYEVGVMTPMKWNSLEGWQKPYHHPDNITVSPTRTPEALAKDIYRRIYHEFVNYETTCIASRSEHMERTKRADEIRRILGMAGLETVSHLQHQHEGRYWHSWNEQAKIDIRFSVHNDSESFKLEINLDNLEDVARIIGAFQGEEV